MLRSWSETILAMEQSRTWDCGFLNGSWWEEGIMRTGILSNFSGKPCASLNSSSFLIRVYFKVMVCPLICTCMPVSLLMRYLILCKIAYIKVVPQIQLLSHTCLPWHGATCLRTAEQRCFSDLTQHKMLLVRVCPMWWNELICSQQNSTSPLLQFLIPTGFLFTFVFLF